MTREEFVKLTGREPRDDDLERVNCPEAGKVGHFHCGLFPCCGQPKFAFHNPGCREWS